MQDYDEAEQAGISLYFGTTNGELLDFQIWLSLFAVNTDIAVLGLSVVSTVLT
ncbi:hypothetical protein SPONL_1392 [uncultured Candidatus Thioglobus sp.]|nr:hypothetical protein SPONL_1392 [uncultured Candidatus Thioglobus sp.]